MGSMIQSPCRSCSLAPGSDKPGPGLPAALYFDLQCQAGEQQAGEAAPRGTMPGRHSPSGEVTRAVHHSVSVIASASSAASLCTAVTDLQALCSESSLAR